MKTLILVSLMCLSLGCTNPPVEVSDATLHSTDATYDSSVDVQQDTSSASTADAGMDAMP